MEKKYWYIIGIAVAANALIFGAIFLKLKTQTILYGVTILMLVAGVPYLLSKYASFSKSKKMEDSFPDFLRDITESIKAGMTIPQAIENSTKTNYGELSTWIKKMNYMISWGIPFPDTIKRMRDGIKHAPYIRRGLSIILQSYYSGGDIASTMQSIAQATTQLQNVEKDKSSILRQQVIIVYVIHFLFIGIIVAMYGVLIPMISTQPTEGGFVSFGTPPSYGYFKTLFFITIMIQSAANALVAGETMEGNLIAGIKHLLIMLPISILAYLMFIFPPKFDINLSLSKSELLPSEDFSIIGSVNFEGEILSDTVVTVELVDQIKTDLTDENGDFEIEVTSPQIEGIYDVVVIVIHEDNTKREIREIYVS